MNTEYHSSGLYHVELLNAVYMRFFWLWRNSQKGLILHDALHINLQCSDLPWQVEIERDSTERQLNFGWEIGHIYQRKKCVH